MTNIEPIIIEQDQDRLTSNERYFETTQKEETNRYWFKDLVFAEFWWSKTSQSYSWPFNRDTMTQSWWFAYSWNIITIPETGYYYLTLVCRWNFTRAPWGYWYTFNWQHFNQSFNSDRWSFNIANYRSSTMRFMEKWETITSTASRFNASFGSLNFQATYRIYEINPNVIWILR